VVLKHDRESIILLGLCIVYVMRASRKCAVIVRCAQDEMERHLFPARIINPQREKLISQTDAIRFIIICAQNENVKIHHQRDFL
jgi:hypothetical protein